MNENIDLTKLLKDCPKGTKFYSKCLGTVEFNDIMKCDNTIMVTIHNGSYIKYNKNGKYFYSDETSEVDLLPSKDQRDWNKWQGPFVDGDIVFYNDTIAIFKEWGDETLFRTHVTKYLCCDSLLDINVPLFGKGVRREIRFATEKEKEKLFQDIKENGYKWNADEKKLENLFEPKFKVGDRIKLKHGDEIGVIKQISDRFYVIKCKNHVHYWAIRQQDDWISIPNEFDPKTLQPFDKVLVRQYAVASWGIDFYSYYDEQYDYAVCTGDVHYDYCIPYNDDTKHLVGKSEEAPEFYRYWKNK